MLGDSKGACGLGGKYRLRAPAAPSPRFSLKKQTRLRKFAAFDWPYLSSAVYSCDTNHRSEPGLGAKRNQVIVEKGGLYA